MSAPQVLPHRDAVRDALESAGLAVGLAQAPPSAEIPASGIYVVLYMAPGRSERESLADTRSDFSALFQVTCVAPDEERCLWACDRVRAALHGPLIVAGRTVWRPTELGGPPAERDTAVSPPLFHAPIQYEIRSTTA